MLCAVKVQPSACASRKLDCFACRPFSFQRVTFPSLVCKSILPPPFARTLFRGLVNRHFHESWLCGDKPYLQLALNDFVVARGEGG